MITEPLSNKESLRGQIIGGKYVVEELLGSGGMGTVWMGRHQILKTRVAIKFIRPQFAERHEARRRFEIEARAAANVQSKHAVQVYDYGVSDFGLPYIVMEYLEGESLSDTLMRVGPFPPVEVAKVIAQAARALSKAHGVGIVHRDLKPDNIFLATNAEDADSDLPYVVKLVDFGIAKMFDQHGEAASDSRGGPLHGPTQEGAVVGTPNFMSPEQLTVGGAPGPLTDLWALGACAFTAMTARLPFEGEVLGDIVLKVCVAPMPVPSQYNPALPPGFDAWFAKACARDPEHRFQTVAELSDSLLQVCGATTGPMRTQFASHVEQEVRYELKKPPPGSEIDLEDLEMPRGMSSRTAFAAGVLLVVTIVFGMVGVLAWRTGQPAAPASTTAGH
jgi:serine/threonine protein kinase